MKTGPEQFQGSGSESRFSNIVKEMAGDFKKATGEPLVKMEDYFKYAKKFVNEEELKDFEALGKFMQFANKDLALIAIDEIKANNDEETKELDKELKNMSDEKKIKVSKFRDIVKDDVREKFSDILKEVSEELELPDGDVDQAEAMKAMSTTLDQLISKLAGNSDKMKEVQKQIIDLKKVAVLASNEATNLKRDGKKSVKKELREEDEPQRGDIPVKEEGDDFEDGDMEDDDDEIFNFSDEEMAELADARKKLEEATAEVEQLEKDIRGDLGEEPEAVVGLEGYGSADNVKVSVTKLGSGAEDLTEDQAAKIAKRLEGTIKDKLAKLGIDTGSRCFIMINAYSNAYTHSHTHAHCSHTLSYPCLHPCS